MNSVDTSRSRLDDVSESDGKENDSKGGSGDFPTDHPPDTLQDIEKNVEEGHEDLQTPESTASEDVFLVKFEDGDPANPRNWTNLRKGLLTFLLGMLALAGSLGSSIIAPAQQAIANEFNVDEQVAVLCISLYVLGFALGPSCWAPISEVYGRKISILPAVFALGIFSIGTAVSQSMTSVLVTRFLAGVAGSAPISNVSAALGDMYSPAARGTAVTFYAVCVCGGPTLGPVIGAALVTKLNWRWTEYVEAMWVFAVFGVAVIVMPEVYPPVLLSRKAKRLRKETGDDQHWHPHESEKMRLNNIFTKYLARPIRMFLTEPLITSVAMYASFVYGLLYMTLEIFPIVYEDQRHWSPVLASLPFLGMLIGICSAVFINLANQPYYHRAVAANNGKAAPEARLPPMVLGGWLFVIGLFWFGWTASPDIHWASPTVATAFIGGGFNTIFQQCLNVLVDTYGPYAASAVAANTILRSFLACALPLAAKPMFRSLGVGPAASVLGGVACLALPIPWLLKRYGLRLRKMSKFAPVQD